MVCHQGLVIAEVTISEAVHDVAAERIQFLARRRLRDTGAGSGAGVGVRGNLQCRRSSEGRVRGNDKVHVELVEVELSSGGSRLFNLVIGRAGRR